MTTKEIRAELLNEDNLKDTLGMHIDMIKGACSKLKFMGRFIAVLKDLEETVRADASIREKNEIARCLAAIDKVLDF